jgi:hypothetical protein
MDTLREVIGRSVNERSLDSGCMGLGGCFDKDGCRCEQRRGLRLNMSWVVFSMYSRRPAVSGRTDYDGIVSLAAVATASAVSMASW